MFYLGYFMYTLIKCEDMFIWTIMCCRQWKISDYQQFSFFELIKEMICRVNSNLCPQCIILSHFVHNRSTLGDTLSAKTKTFDYCNLQSLPYFIVFFWGSSDRVQTFRCFKDMTSDFFSFGNYHWHSSSVYINKITWRILYKRFLFFSILHWLSSAAMLSLQNNYRSSKNQGR